MKTLREKILACGLETGHFVLASGNHSTEKFEFDAIAARRFTLFRKVVDGLGDLIVQTPEFADVDTIITVGNGANCLAQPVSRKVANVFDRQMNYIESTYRVTDEGKRFRLKKGNIFARGKRCIIVDDVYSYGTNAGKVAELVQNFGGVILGAAVVLDRSGDDGEVSRLRLPDSELYVPVESLVKASMPSWPEENCLDELAARGQDQELCPTT